MTPINSIPDSYLALIQLLSPLIVFASLIVSGELVEENANSQNSIFNGLTVNEIDQNCTDLEFCPSIDYGPHSPYVPCNYLPLDFLDCEELVDHQGNETSLESTGVGCLKFGGQRKVYIGSRFCHVLNGIECYGNRTFIREGFPCLRYNDHYFVTTLLFSLLLGFLGMDRFYLGHTGTAIGKLLTIGGVGIWWIVDIILLITGNLMPEDGSNWMPYA